MVIENEKLSLINKCYSDNLQIENSKLCCTIDSTTMEGSVYRGVNLSGSYFQKGEMRSAEFEQMGMANCVFQRWQQ